MQAARADEHDLITRSELARQGSARAQRAATPTAAPASSMSRGSTQSRQRRRLAPAPGAAGVVAGAAPALQQRLRARGVRVPLRRARGEVSVDDEWQRADAAEVVEDRRDRVVGDVGEAVEAAALEHLASDDRLRAEALDDERERAAIQLEHERRLAPGGINCPPTTRAEQRGGGERLGHCQALARVERGVVHAGLAVARSSRLVAHGVSLRPGLAPRCARRHERAPWQRSIRTSDRCSPRRRRGASCAAMLCSSNGSRRRS